MSETLQFGLTMLAVGMGGTLLTLLAMVGIIRALTMIFPVENPPDAASESKGESP
jgi:hypothetical protein